MKVISFSKDRKRAQVIVLEKDPKSGDTAFVTRHAHRMPGTENKYTIKDRKVYGFKADTGERVITISGNTVTA